MLDIRYIRQNPDKIREAVVKKRFDLDVDALLALDDRRRQLQQELDALRHEQKKAGEMIGQIRGKGKKKDTNPADLAAFEAQLADTMKRMEEVKARSKQLEEEAQKVQQEFDTVMLRVPQVPDDDVPVGKDDTENVEIRRWGEVRQFDFAAQGPRDPRRRTRHARRRPRREARRHPLATSCSGPARCCTRPSCASPST